jgi:hypothetical protein
LRERLPMHALADADRDRLAEVLARLLFSAWQRRADKEVSPDNTGPRHDDRPRANAGDVDEPTCNDPSRQLDQKRRRLP